VQGDLAGLGEHVVHVAQVGNERGTARGRFGGGRFEGHARGGECEKCGATFEVTELIDPRVAIEGDGSVDYVVPEMLLLNGNYLLTAAIFDHDGVYAYDHQSHSYLFSIVPGSIGERYGMIYLPSRWEHRNGAH